MLACRRIDKGGTLTRGSAVRLQPRLAYERERRRAQKGVALSVAQPLAPHVSVVAASSLNFVCAAGTASTLNLPSIAPTDWRNATIQMHSIVEMMTRSRQDEPCLGWIPSWGSFFTR